MVSTRFARTTFTDSVPQVPLLPSGNVVLELTELGKTLPMSQFSMTYGLNAIPTAVARVPLGRNARTGKPAEVYGMIEDLKQMTKVVVSLSGDLGEYNPAGTSWSEKGTGPVIFIGYIAGISYRRTMGSVSLIINLIHKLFDMTQSSAGASDVVPGSPNSLLMPAHLRGSGGNQVGNPCDRFTDDLKTDMNIDFSDGLLKCLYNLATESQLQTHSGKGQPDSWCTGSAITGVGNLADPVSNERVKAVIEGDDGDWKGIKNYGGADSTLTAQGNPYTEAYKLDAVSDAQKTHATSQIGKAMFNSFAGTSMWSMLIGSICPDFGLGIVPMADRAFLVPILPCLRSTTAKPAKPAVPAVTPLVGPPTPAVPAVPAVPGTKKIKATEIADFQMTTASQRPMYGVGIIGTYSNAAISRKKTDNKQCVGAYFAVDAPAGDPAANGMWMFQPAPRWMDDWVSTEPGSADGGTPPPSAVERMLSKESHDATGGEAAPGVERDPDAEAEGWNDPMKGYAKLLYAVNALRDRTGTVTGKLRFDISPGSTVIIGGEELGDVTPGVDSLPTAMVGFVARVTVTINAELASSATTFELTHLRTQDEDITAEDGRISLKKHPFYNTQFELAPLVEGLDI